MRLKKYILLFAGLILSTVFSVGQNDFKFHYQIKNLFADSITKANIDTTNINAGLVKIHVESYRITNIAHYELKITSKDTTIKKPNMGNHDMGKEYYSIRLKPNTYEFEIEGLFFTSWKQTINIRNGANIKVTVADQYFSDTYLINSRKELAKKDIDKIRKCVFDNPDWEEKCKTKNYFVTKIDTMVNRPAIYNPGTKK
jgi:hypothetical protein